MWCSAMQRSREAAASKARAWFPVPFSFLLFNEKWLGKCCSHRDSFVCGGNAQRFSLRMCEQLFLLGLDAFYRLRMLSLLALTSKNTV